MMNKSVEEKAMELIRNALDEVTKFEEINDVIEYLDTGATFFKLMKGLCILIKAGDELKARYSVDLKNLKTNEEKMNLLKDTVSTVFDLRDTFFTNMND